MLLIASVVPLKDVIKRQLIKWGYTPVVATDIPEAVMLLNSNKPDAVICCLAQFEVSTLQVILEHLKEVPVILVSQVADTAKTLEAIRLGCIDFITETNLQELQQALTRALKSLQRLRQQKRLEEALRESEERYALAARGANDGLWDWKFGSFGHPAKVYLSPRWKAMLGYAANEIGDNPDEWLKLIHSEDRERVKVLLTQHLEGKTTQFECEYRLLKRDQRYSWVVTRGLAVFDASGKPIRIAGSTGLAKRGAVHDPITDLPNRLLLLERLSHEVVRCKQQENYQYAVLLVDVDRFKLVAETLGHKKSDDVLIEIAKRLQQSIRPQDLLTRLSGDTFAILLEDVKSILATTQIAQEIQKRLGQLLRIEREEIFLTACIGIAMSATGYERAEDVLRDSELAMHRAKDKGRGKIELFDIAMHAHAVEQLHVENDLRRALARDEFILHYQPILDLKQGVIVGFEALVRWQHPERGFIPPIEFIFIAEETGLIVPLGEWVLNKACQKLRQWQKKFVRQNPLYLSVNLSIKQLEHPNLVNTTAEIIARNSIIKETLKLEVTESVLMENIEFAERILHAFKNLGIPLLMDDFGTGYSSLAALHLLPIDALKIDRGFVNNMLNNERSRVIVRSIIHLAQGLQLKIIAEGVETKEQMLELQKSGCDFAQGYFFSKPVDEHKAEELLNKTFTLE